MDGLSRLLIVGLCLGVRCAPAPGNHGRLRPTDPPGAARAATPMPAATNAPSIGYATMAADGTIELHVRAEGPGGSLGDALLRYPPGHEDYQRILEHLGGLKPGERKPVPPWPD